MRIRFIPPDPRAGMVVTMDSRRGQDFIDAGRAERLTESGEVLARAAPLAAVPAPVATDTRRPRKSARGPE